ncbi:MAG: DUF896 domain-containing protein [Oscillospiraceae bacterium]
MELNLDRINELAAIKKQRELSDIEKTEQQELRKIYIEAYKASLRSHLDNIVLVDKDGSKTKLSPKSQKKNGNV